MDDERTIRDLLSEMLSNRGFEVETAASGEEALAMYKKALRGRRRYDVVIMDLVVSKGMGGKEAIGKLMKLDPHVRAIVSSGYSEEAVMSDHLKHGFRAVVSKPYKISDLVRAIREVLEE